jgi:hypothetical protein
MNNQKNVVESFKAWWAEINDNEKIGLITLAYIIGLIFLVNFGIVIGRALYN